jgi:predicted Zn-dependent peptidase
MGYLMVGHRDHFERQMSLLSAILFRAAIGEKAVREAREVVLEEILRRESRPDTRVGDLFQALLYEGSSYARTGLGNERTVSTVTREEVAAHYGRVYRPNNMIVLVAGGLGGEEVLPVLKETFGKADPGAGISGPAVPPPLQGRRRYRLETEIPDIRIRIGFNGPDPREEDAEALELLGRLLGGDGGLLKRALEADGFSPRAVGAGLSVNRGFSRFEISADLPAATDPEAALDAILSEIGRVAADRPMAGEVDAARKALVSGEIMGREKLHYYLMGKASSVLAGSPGQGFSEGRWDRFSPDDMSRVAARYLAAAPYAALLSSPSGVAEVKEEEATAPRERRILDNGLTVIAEQRAGSAVFAVHLMTRRRSALEPEGKAGIADFVHRLIARGTEKRTREEIEKGLREAGASFSAAGNPTVPFGDFYTSRLYSYLRLESLQEKAEEAVDLLADMVGKATFPSGEVEDVRGEMRDYIAFRDASPGALAARLLAERLYGPGALGHDVLGSEETLNSISRENLLSFRDRYFTGGNVILSVVSGMAPGKAIDLLAPLFAGLPPGRPLPETVPAPTSSSEPLERELGKPQGALAMGAVSGPVAEGDRAALTVVRGLLNDRLVRELREKEGLAYSVGASFGAVEGSAVLTVSMGTAPEKIEQAREGIRREVAGLRTMEVTADDVTRHANAVTGRLQMRMLSSLSRAFYLGLAERGGLAHTFGEDYRKLLLGLSPADIEAAVKSYLPDDLSEVIVR